MNLRVLTSGPAQCTCTCTPSKPRGAYWDSGPVSNVKLYLQIPPTGAQNRITIFLRNLDEIVQEHKYTDTGVIRTKPQTLWTEGYRQPDLCTRIFSISAYGCIAADLGLDNGFTVQICQWQKSFQ